MNQTLGTLRFLDPRSHWTSEPYDFTPWLADNLHLLSSALGLDSIELLEIEKPVGDFRVDILGQEPGPAGRRVIVENQLSRTDHNHLGQLLAYASGLNAEIVVWVSPEFRDEYREALNWLNDKTNDDVAFFGVEIQLLQIDDSPPAPHFRVVVEPSEFLKEMESTTSQTVTDRQARYHSFFSELLNLLKETFPSFTSAKRVGYESWYNFGAGRTGFAIGWAFASGSEFRVELYIDVGDRGKNKLAFDTLHESREEIEATLGPLQWQRLNERRASRIYAYRPGSIDDPDATLAELKPWAIETLVAFRNEFAGRLQPLELDTLEVME